MNTRHLTKKYKHKSRSKKSRKSKRNGKTGRSGRSGRSGRRILKGGVPSVRPSARPSDRPRPSSASIRPIIGTPFKPPQKTIFDKIKKKEEINLIDEQIEIEKQNFIRYFFTGLNQNNFPVALCALHTFYTCGIDISDINKVIRSEEFKTMYATTFFDVVKNGIHANIEPQERLMFFLSYIFSKLLEGSRATIPCSNGVVLHFTPGTGTFLETLKKFFGYLDTACVLTISYEITQTIFYIIEKSNYKQNGVLPIGVTKGQLALYHVIQHLHFLGSINYKTAEGKMIPQFPGIVALLEQMTRGVGDGRIYSFNTTNLYSLIKMTLDDSILFNYS